MGMGISMEIRFRVIPVFCVSVISTCLILVLLFHTTSNSSHGSIETQFLVAILMMKINIFGLIALSLIEFFKRLNNVFSRFFTMLLVNLVAFFVEDFKKETENVIKDGGSIIVWHKRPSMELMSLDTLMLILVMTLLALICYLVSLYIVERINFNN